MFHYGVNKLYSKNVIRIMLIISYNNVGFNCHWRNIYCWPLCYSAWRGTVWYLSSTGRIKDSSSVSKAKPTGVDHNRSSNLFFEADYDAQCDLARAVSFNFQHRIDHHDHIMGRKKYKCTIVHVCWTHLAWQLMGLLLCMMTTELCRHCCSVQRLVRVTIEL